MDGLGRILRVSTGRNFRWWRIRFTWVAKGGIKVYDGKNHTVLGTRGDMYDHILLVSGV